MNQAIDAKWLAKHGVNPTGGFSEINEIARRAKQRCVAAEGGGLPAPPAKTSLFAKLFCLFYRKQFTGNTLRGG